MVFKRIDIHAHLNFAAYTDDRDATMRRALESGTAVINVGTQLDTSRAAVELARAYPEGVYAIVGLHPVHTSASHHDLSELGEGGQAFTSRGEAFDPAPYRELLRDPRTVGIGECGLDYYRKDAVAEERSRQRDAFMRQIELSNETGKPLMLHIRDAYGDALELLRAHHRPAPSLVYGGTGARGDVHFFAGSTDEAREFLDLGYTLSFTGVITFARAYEKLVSYVPLDMIQAETDCPFVAPIPHRGARNEPAFVSETVATIARIKGLSLEVVEAALLENARRVWGVMV